MKFITPKKIIWFRTKTLHKDMWKGTLSSENNEIDDILSEFIFSVVETSDGKFFYTCPFFPGMKGEVKSIESGRLKCQEWFNKYVNALTDERMSYINDDQVNGIYHGDM